MKRAPALAPDRRPRLRRTGAGRISSPMHARAEPGASPRGTSPSPEVPALRVRGLFKRYGWKWALKDVDLDVERGASLALVGPNGAGKTTLLRVLATLVRPSRGEVRVFGHSVHDAGDEVRRRTGLMTTSGYLYDELTGAENLRFAALMSGLRPDADRGRRMLERVGLSEAADRRVRGYSSGMRKRLELARLLLRTPELLLMDEPYASLDAEGVALVDEVVREAREAGRTVVFASHQMGEALRTADRVAVLKDGTVRATGTPAEMAADLPLGEAGGGGAWEALT